MPLSERYRPDPRWLTLGEGFSDPVPAAVFPKRILRFRNDRHAATVGLDGLTDDEWAAHFAGFAPLPDNLPKPLALRYHGHQFHSYNPYLGDGRGFLFAQLRDDRGRLLDLGTKGSGTTPYSRGGDGRLTLKGGVREILATEMLEALGVDTSKSFSLFETGEELWRGDEPSPTRSSVLVRLSHSHVRFGSFQRLAAYRDVAGLRKLLDYAIAHFHPHAKGPADFLRAVSDKVAFTTGRWMVAGFVHGVLNTDNMNVTGESFDYGPWRFLPECDPRFTAAYFDETGLYAYGRQAPAVRWNLDQLARALTPLGEP
ncbi:MAG: protein adenylyltransferase SelO family protein, partial [Myxococcota bacterium]